MSSFLLGRLIWKHLFRSWRRNSLSWCSRSSSSVASWRFIHEHLFCCTRGNLNSLISCCSRSLLCCCFRCSRRNSSCISSDWWSDFIVWNNCFDYFLRFILIQSIEDRSWEILGYSNPRSRFNVSKQERYDEMRSRRDRPVKIERSWEENDNREWENRCELDIFSILLEERVLRHTTLCSAHWEIAERNERGDNREDTVRVLFREILEPEHAIRTELRELIRHGCHVSQRNEPCDQHGDLHHRK